MHTFHLETCNCCGDSTYGFNCKYCKEFVCNLCILYFSCIECYAKNGGDLPEPFKSRLERLYLVDGIKYKKFEKDFKSQTN